MLRTRLATRVCRTRSVIELDYQMFNPQDVFPDPNVDPAVRPWARKITEAVRGLGYEVVNTKQAQNGDNRAAAGQLAVLGRQIDTLNLTVNDLRSRRSYIVNPAALSVTGNATVAPFPTGTITFTMTAPEVTRTAQIGFTATMSNTGGTANSVSAFVELLYGGVVLSNTQISVPRPTSAPTSWVDSINFYSFATIPGTVAPEFTVRITRVGFTGVSTTLTIDNMTAFIQYGDAV